MISGAGVTPQVSGPTRRTGEIRVPRVGHPRHTEALTLRPCAGPAPAPPVRIDLLREVTPDGRMLRDNEVRTPVLEAPSDENLRDR